MSNTAFALIGYIGWMVILMLVMECLRTYLVLVKGKPANSFAVDGSDTFPLLHRLTRSHANCYEHFPIVGGILIFVLATKWTGVTEGLALWVLAARMLQSCTHIFSNGLYAVQVRFVFFTAQLLIVVFWIVQILLPLL